MKELEETASVEYPRPDGAKPDRMFQFFVWFWMSLVGSALLILVGAMAASLLVYVGAYDR